MKLETTRSAEYCIIFHELAETKLFMYQTAERKKEIRKTFVIHNTR